MLCKGNTVPYKHCALQKFLRPRAWDLTLPLSSEPGISSAVARLVRYDLPLNSLCWLLAVIFVTFSWLEIISRRVFSITLSGPKTKLCGLHFPGMEIAVMCFFWTSGFSPSIMDLSKMIERAHTVKTSWLSGASYLVLWTCIYPIGSNTQVYSGILSNWLYCIYPIGSYTQVY